MGEGAGLARRKKEIHRIFQENTARPRNKQHSVCLRMVWCCSNKVRDLELLKTKLRQWLKTF